MLIYNIRTVPSPPIETLVSTAADNGNGNGNGNNGRVSVATNALRNHYKDEVNASGKVKTNGNGAGNGVGAEGVRPTVEELCFAVDDVGNNWMRVPLRIGEGRMGWEEALVGCLKDVCSVSMSQMIYFRKLMFFSLLRSTPLYALFPVYGSSSSDFVRTTATSQGYLLRDLYSRASLNAAEIPHLHLTAHPHSPLHRPPHDIPTTNPARVHLAMDLGYVLRCRVRGIISSHLVIGLRFCSSCVNLRRRASRCICIWRVVKSS